MKSIRVIGMSQFAEEYNHKRPNGLGNTSLIATFQSIFMQVDEPRFRLRDAQLRAYGLRIALEAKLPPGILAQDSIESNISIVNTIGGFEIRLANGSRIKRLNQADQTLVMSLLSNPMQGTLVLEGLRGRRGGELGLENAVDQAWLGALVVGEGSFFARGFRTGKTREPCLVIAMQDEDAVNKAADLMGVTMTKGSVSESSGKILWRATAVGARMMEVFELLRPFLTRRKIKQAEDTIRKARESGFVTKGEMKDNQENRIVSELTTQPGLSTRDIGIRLGIGYTYAMKYLCELRDRSTVYGIVGGSANRPRLNWFLAQSSKSTPRLSAEISDLQRTT